MVFPWSRPFETLIKRNQSMSVFSLETSPSRSAMPLPVLGFARRLLKLWRDKRSERALSSLPYETLKDIGYPAARDERNDPHA